MTYELILHFHVVLIRESKSGELSHAFVLNECLEPNPSFAYIAVKLCKQARHNGFCVAETCSVACASSSTVALRCLSCCQLLVHRALLPSSYVLEMGAEWDVLRELIGYKCPGKLLSHS